MSVSKVSRSIWCSPTTGVFFEKTGVLSSTFDHHLPHQISFQTPPIFSADLHIRAKELLQGTTATTGAFNHFTQSNLSVRWCCECVSCITLLQMSVGIFFLFGCRAIKRNKICSSGPNRCLLSAGEKGSGSHTHTLTHARCMSLCVGVAEQQHKKVRCVGVSMLNSAGFSETNQFNVEGHLKSRISK